VSVHQVEEAMVKQRRLHSKWPLSSEKEFRKNPGQDKASQGYIHNNKLPLTRPPLIFYHLSIMPLGYESIKGLTH
jgi:hypothetical protein